MPIWEQNCSIGIWGFLCWLNHKFVKAMAGDQSRRQGSQLPQCSACYASSLPERATHATSDALTCYWSTLIHCHLWSHKPNVHKCKWSKMNPTGLTNLNGPIDASSSCSGHKEHPKDLGHCEMCAALKDVLDPMDGARLGKLNRGICHSLLNKIPLLFLSYFAL